MIHPCTGVEPWFNPLYVFIVCELILTVKTVPDASYGLVVTIVIYITACVPQITEELNALKLEYDEIIEDLELKVAGDIQLFVITYHCEPFTEHTVE